MEKFKRTKIDNTEPVISVRGGRFYYSSTFSRLAQLDKYHFVTYFIDEQKREVGFMFTDNRLDSDSYSLGQSPGKKNVFRSSAGELINQNNWVRVIHDQKRSDLKNFLAFERKGLWIIQLRPSFEVRVLRESASDIAPSHIGIYTYIDNSGITPGGETVYIGKGNVKNRLREGERKSWKFDEIRYSIISEEDLQFEWQNYWLLQHKQYNNGRLPYYNNNAGHSNK